MKTLKNMLLSLLILTLPLLLVITSIRIVLSPLFLEVEYRLPGFPEDPFRFHLRRTIALCPPVR